MIKFKNVSKDYQIGDQKIEALKDINFTIEAGELTVILGPSGSGKSTALNLLGGMDKSTSGAISFEGRNISELTSDKLTEYRRKIIGFVFQFYNLIPNLTASENVGIAASLTNTVDESEHFLNEVGLTNRKDNFPNQLSGGEMQRVAIARALAKKPKLLLCDEPTGALDSKTGKKIIEVLKGIANKGQTAVVLVTHNAVFADIANKVIKLHDGKVASIKVNKNPITVAEVEY